MANDQFLIGYFEPGHSFKGKQLPLTNDEELKNMYVDHYKRRAINLWVKPKQKKRPRDLDDADNSRPAKRSSTYESHLEKMDDLENILEKLNKESNYTPEQLHCWANLMQMKKHDSYEDPPRSLSLVDDQKVVPIAQFQVLENVSSYVHSALTS